MRHKQFTKHFRWQGYLYTIRLTVCVERYSISKSGLWPPGGKLYRYGHYSTKITGGFFHIGPFADVRMELTAPAL